MTVISDYSEQSAIPENITVAIQDHLQNPGKPVTRICKEHRVSRATFYRHLGKLSSEALNVPDFSSGAVCPKCAEEFPPSVTDRELLTHGVSCPKGDADFKFAAWNLLREMQCSSRSPILQSSTSTIADSGAETTPELSQSSNSTEIALKTIPPSEPDPDDIDEQWNAFVREVKQDVWDVVPYEADTFWNAKFLDGEIASDWNYASWLHSYWESVPRFGPRRCHTTLRK